jgi:Holliday junction resolvasome RuvABC endonuclease subunit
VLLLLFGEGGIEPARPQPRRGHQRCPLYGGFLGTLTAWCEEHEIPYEGVPVATIKRFATGRGKADKAAMVAAIRAHGFAPADDNEADAIALLLWATTSPKGRA